MTSLVGSSSSSFLGAQKQNKKDNNELVNRQLLQVHENKRIKDDDELALVIIYFGCIETKEKKTTTSIGSSSSFLGAQKWKKKRQWRTLAHCHLLLWVHRNKRKKDNDKHWLVIVIFGCTKMKEKKTMTNVSSLSSSLGAQKQNKKDDNEELAHCHLLWVHTNQRKRDDDEHWLVIVFFKWIETKEKKTMMSANLSLSSLGA